MSTYKKVPLSAESEDMLKKVFGKRYAPRCRIEPSGCIVPPSLDLEAIKNMEVFEDDIFIVTQPKCGTTWMQEMVWHIMNDVDLEKAQSDQFYRVPFLELGSLLPPCGENWKMTTYPPDNVPKDSDNVTWFMLHSIEYCKRLPRPRILKSHLPLSLLPDNLVEKCKVL